MSSTAPTMMIYASSWNAQPSFRLLPVSPDAPFNEGIFDPATSTLAMVSKESNDKPHMLPRLSEEGNALPVRGRKTAPGAQPELQMQRIIIPTYYEHYLSSIEDIQRFLEEVCINPTHPAVEACFALVREAHAEAVVNATAHLDGTTPPVNLHPELTTVPAVEPPVPTPEPVTPVERELHNPDGTTTTTEV